jgi:hypothetical protein
MLFGYPRALTPTRPARLYLVYAIFWGFGSRRAFAILPITDCFVADGRAVYTVLNPMIGGTLDFRGISFSVWEIHKPIAGDVGSNAAAGKMDNQCVEKIPLFVFCWMERRPPTVGRYPRAHLRSLG